MGNSWIPRRQNADFLEPTVECSKAVHGLSIAILCKVLLCLTSMFVLAAKRMD